jgi:hypothetical protein
MGGHDEAKRSFLRPRERAQKNWRDANPFYFIFPVSPGMDYCIDVLYFVFYAKLTFYHIPKF